MDEADSSSNWNIFGDRVKEEYDGWKHPVMSGDSGLNEARVMVLEACGKTSVDCCRVKAYIKRKKHTQALAVNVFRSKEEPISFLLVSVLVPYGRCDAVIPLKPPALLRSLLLPAAIPVGDSWRHWVYFRMVKCLGRSLQMLFALSVLSGVQSSVYKWNCSVIKNGLYYLWLLWGTVRDHHSKQNRAVPRCYGKHSNFHSALGYGYKRGRSCVHFLGYPHLCANQGNCQLTEMGSPN